MKNVHDAAQEMLDVVYGMPAGDGFGAISAATATMVSGYMGIYGRTLEDAEALLENMHESTVEKLRECWGKVQRNDC